MKKWILSVLGILALAGMLQAGDGRGMGSEHGHFMEPTQADYDCCYVTIAQQQANYEAAKAKGQFDGMVDYAMFHWVKAWVYNNGALARIENSQKHLVKADLTEALGFLDKADAEIALAKPTSQTKACSAKVKKNRSAAKELLNKIEVGGEE